MIFNMKNPFVFHALWVVSVWHFVHVGVVWARWAGVSPELGL